MSDTNEVKTESANLWRKCSTCKKPIDFGATYYVCSVSTCNGQRTGYVFCKVGCWESHVPGARHRDAAAIEKRAPTREAAAREATALAERERGASAPASGVSEDGSVARAPVRVLASNTASSSRSMSGGFGSRSAGAPSEIASSSPSATPANPAISREVLVIASRLKEFIDLKSGGYNTSQSVMDVLSDHLRHVCDRAIENARADGRKTVMDRDFEFLKGR